jgi:hypothetical protein
MATVRIAPTPSAYDLATRLPAATYLADRLDRITKIFEAGSGTRRKMAIGAKRDAAERHISALERRIGDAAPRDISDVVAQCTLLAHTIEVVFEAPAAGRSASVRDDVIRRMHQIVHRLAALSDTDVRAIGGDFYLRPQFSPEALAARTGAAS